MLRLALLFIMASTTAFADGNHYVLKPELDANGGKLTLNFETTDIVPNNCDFHVGRMEYIAAMKILLVDTLAEPCLIDRTGKRRGRVKWDIPVSLRGNSKFCVVLNQEKAGAVVLSHEKTDFRATTDVNCD